MLGFSSSAAGRTPGMPHRRRRSWLVSDDDCWVLGQRRPAVRLT